MAHERTVPVSAGAQLLDQKWHAALVPQLAQKLDRRFALGIIRQRLDEDLAPPGIALFSTKEGRGEVVLCSCHLAHGSNACLTERCQRLDGVDGIPGPCFTQERQERL